MINALSSLGLKDIPPLPEKFVPFFRTRVRKSPCKPAPIRGEAAEKAGMCGGENAHTLPTELRTAN